jgi:hypothetical protein
MYCSLETEEVKTRIPLINFGLDRRLRLGSFLVLCTTLAGCTSEVEILSVSSGLNDSDSSDTLAVLPDVALTACNTRTKVINLSISTTNAIENPIFFLQCPRRIRSGQGLRGFTSTLSTGARPVDRGVEDIDACVELLAER